MTADVFTNLEHGALRIEKRRRVQSSGAIERRLATTQGFRELRHQGSRNQRLIARNRSGIQTQYGLDRSLAADPATGADIKVALQAFQTDVRFVRRDADAIRRKL